MLGLKDKIKELPILGSVKESHPSSGQFPITNEAIEALVALGYKNSRAREVVKDIINSSNDKELTTQELIKQSLKYMNK